jgi:hypothetical protein
MLGMVMDRTQNGELDENMLGSAVAFLLTVPSEASSQGLHYARKR